MQKQGTISSSACPPCSSLICPAACSGNAPSQPRVFFLVASSQYRGKPPLVIDPTRLAAQQFLCLLPTFCFIVRRRQEGVRLYLLRCHVLHSRRPARFAELTLNMARNAHQSHCSYVADSWQRFNLLFLRVQPVMEARMAVPRSGFLVAV